MVRRRGFLFDLSRSSVCVDASLDQVELLMEERRSISI